TGRGRVPRRAHNATGPMTSAARAAPRWMAMTGVSCMKGSVFDGSGAMDALCAAALPAASGLGRSRVRVARNAYTGLRNAGPRAGFTAAIPQRHGGDAGDSYNPQHEDQVLDRWC